MRRGIFCFLIVCCLAGPGVAPAQVFEGDVRVVDGDTLRVGEARVRLHGIDSLENDQKCGGRGIGVWDCGLWVTREVKRRYEGRRARCETRDRDRYDRIVARCFVDGADIAEVLVGEGLAFAYRRYSMDYDLTEKGAAVAEKGLHNVEFTLPSAFRARQREARAKWSAASADVSPDCVIKGNVSRSSGERIYHVPGQRDYAATIITEARGERWFCSERDALDAGWRAALR